MLATNFFCSLLSCALFATYCAIPRTAGAQTGKEHVAPEQADVLFFDDFDGPALDTARWVPGEHQWGTGANNNNGVIPQNLNLVRVVDPATGLLITALDTQMHGDKYRGKVPGIQKAVIGFEAGNPLAYSTPGSYGNGFVRTGGIVWTRLRYGPAKYQIRMKALQKPGGETSIWNYYEPQSLAPGSGTYSEIDIEIPANGSHGDMSVAGLNTYATHEGASPFTDSSVCNCLPTPVGNQADGKFHLYEIDWYDGSDGSKPRVQWYLDGTLVQTSERDIPVSPAQLWIGAWPAAWSHDGVWDYDTQDEYIDYVRISKLSGNTYPTSPLPAPQNLSIGTSSATTVDLAWQEPADSREVAGYNILLNGMPFQQTDGTHIEIKGLAPGTSLSFTVEALNSAMIASPPSNAVSLSLPKHAPACVANPTVPVTRLAAKTTVKNGVNSVKLTWDVPVEGTRDGTIGGVGCSIVSYAISSSADGTMIKTGGLTGSYVQKLTVPGEYRYEVSPYNQFGIGPAQSVTVVVR